MLFTGAGAIVPWGAKRTQQITDMICEDKVFKSKGGQSLGHWLYEKLKGYYNRDPESVNFETIFNALEYLITFYGSRDFDSLAAYKNVMPALFVEEEHFGEILDFNSIYTRREEGWQSVLIPNEFYSFWRTPHAFIEAVFRRFTNLVIQEVERYSRTVDRYTELNGLLGEFLAAREGVLRCYTTNYDRTIPTIFTGELFEGFTEVDGEMKFDAQKVLLDETVSTYYSLHGSAHYELDFPRNVKLVKERFVRDFGSGSSSNVDQDGRYLYHTNIISGFNKVARILGNPFSQFYHRFYQDCLSANEIYIVGYSFGDIHLNVAMRNAVEANRKLKVTVIDRVVFEGEDIELSEYDWLDLSRKYRSLLPPRYGVRELNVGNANRILIYRKGYEQFLRRREWAG